MAFSSGTYTLPGAALNTGDTVSATENNTFRNDVAAAFNLTWLRNGTAAATADIPMGGYSFTNCAAVGSNGSLLLKVNNGTTAATLDASGNLLVKKTSLTNTGRGAYIRADNGNSATVCATGDGTSGTALFLGNEENVGATRFQVLGNGNVQNLNNSYGATSDIKLKENIVDASPKLAALNQVRVVNYNFIGDTQKQLGVVAQELEQVFPGMVDETVDRDDESNDLGTTTKSVKYSVFVPMLIKAVQEMKTIIDDQAARIAALETK